MPTATGCVVKTSAAVVGVYVFNKCGELMYGLNANAQTISKVTSEFNCE